MLISAINTIAQLKLRLSSCKLFPFSVSGKSVRQVRNSRHHARPTIQRRLFHIVLHILALLRYIYAQLCNHLGLRDNMLEKDRAYTLSQVAQHKSKKDCWLAINGRVLDVSKFLEEHPGGGEVLIEHAGTDATKAFEDIGHSKAALNLFSTFQVGYVQGYSIKQLDDRPQEEQSMKTKEMEAFVIKDDGENKHTLIVEFLVPLLVAGVYFGYRCMT